MAVKIETRPKEHTYSTRGPIYFPSFVTPPTACTCFSMTIYSFDKHGMSKKVIRERF